MRSRQEISLAVVVGGCLLYSGVARASDTYISALVESQGIDHESTSNPTAAHLPKVSLLPVTFKLAALFFKIILKLTLFKIIVKFIAIICLLLFIPALDIKSSMEDVMNSEKEEGKSSPHEPLLEFVHQSIQKFEGSKTNNR